MQTNDPGYAPRLRRPLAMVAALAGALSLGSLPPLPSANAAANLRILVDGKTVDVSDSAETVSQALTAAGVHVDSDDLVSPPANAAIPADGKIRVTRVRYTEGTLNAPIRYQTVVRPATRGNRPYHPTVAHEGKNGLKRITYRARIVDGKEVSRETISEEVLREPVHEIVISRNPTSLGSRGAYVGKRTLTLLATAYDPGPGSCGKYANGITCNGKRAGYGIIAVDPKVIPLGSKLLVPGYGYGIAADVGGAIKGNRIDLGFNSRPAAFKWGKKWLKVTIVD